MFFVGFGIKTDTYEGRSKCTPVNHAQKTQQNAKTYVALRVDVFGIKRQRHRVELVFGVQFHVGDIGPAEIPQANAHNY